MATEPLTIDSESMGNPERFLAFADLEPRVLALPPAPRDRGRVALIVRRGEKGLREAPLRVCLGAETGVPGDRWNRSARRAVKAEISYHFETGFIELELIARAARVRARGDHQQKRRITLRQRQHADAAVVDNLAAIGVRRFQQRRFGSNGDAFGQVAHLDGLNLHRAHALARLAGRLTDGRAEVVGAAARRHARAGLAQVVGGDYMSEHWLATFAILLITQTSGVVD